MHMHRKQQRMPLQALQAALRFLFWLQTASLWQVRTASQERWRSQAASESRRTGMMCTPRCGRPRRRPASTRSSCRRAAPARALGARAGCLLPLLRARVAVVEDFPQPPDTVAQHWPRSQPHMPGLKGATPGRLDMTTLTCPACHGAQSPCKLPHVGVLGGTLQHPCHPLVCMWCGA